jgi:hypothetical protein
MEMRQIYEAVVAKVWELVVDSVSWTCMALTKGAYVGGSESLPGLGKKLARIFSWSSCLLQQGPSQVAES